MLLAIVFKAVKEKAHFRKGCIKPFTISLVPLLIARLRIEVRAGVFQIYMLAETELTERAGSSQGVKNIAFLPVEMRKRLSSLSGW